MRLYYLGSNLVLSGFLGPSPLLALAEQVVGHGGDARGQGGFAAVDVAAHADQQHHGAGVAFDAVLARDRLAEIRGRDRVGAHVDRSEEHTSELQSLMRHSYDVFSWKKKTKYTRRLKKKQIKQKPNITQE